MSDNRTIVVDGDEVEVPSHYTLLQACEEAGREIPRFCYHERLSVAGNCRMCLVEVKGAPKPVASCEQNVRDLRPGPDGEPPEIMTTTDTVKKAREGVMEFLLINHPLDCPICDQGGECDLQDQAMGYGDADSRYLEDKFVPPDPHMGPLIKTVMTRCIKCTRCVRFSTEVAGVEEMGLIGRGEEAAIITYLEQALHSELSGNVIDLCPVGALTSKPYAFKARPWELRKTESIDVMDAVGANIRIDARGREVMRILPRNHDDVNEEWISDKTRYVYDGLKTQRLDRPYVKKDGKLQAASWDDAFQAIDEKVKVATPNEIGAIVGDLACAESMKALKDLMAKIGSPNIDCRQDGAKIGGGPREAYLFNSTITGVEEADAILLVGTNPRWEAPLINARLRKNYLDGHAKIAAVGPDCDWIYDVDYLGDSPKALDEIARGSHAFAQTLRDAKRPMVIVGMGALSRDDGAAILSAVAKIAQDTGMLIAGDDEEPGWNGLNILHTAAARVAGLDLGLLPGHNGKDVAAMVTAAKAGELKVLFLLGADELPDTHLGNAFVVYLGSHGDQGAHLADVILPAAAYTEKNATWVNTEGRVQLGQMASFPPGDAREDWTILRALSEAMGMTLPYDNLDQLRGAMADDAPVFNTIDYAPGADSAGDLNLSEFGQGGVIADTPLASTMSDFYFTNPIARASKIMAECSAEKMAGGQAAAAAE